MVELLSEANLGKAINLMCFFFDTQKRMTRLENVNYKEHEPCIYAMWHSHQCSLYGIKNYQKTNVLISNSKDGEFIAQVIKKSFGFKVARGSTARKGAVEATMKLIDLLKSGENAAIMVDGPHGPAKVVKKGIIKIAKLSGAPIIPMTWYSSTINLLKFPSWDKMEIPIGPINMIDLYGEPLYVPADGDETSDKECQLELQRRLLALDEEAPKEFNKIYWHGLWKRKK